MWYEVGNAIGAGAHDQNAERQYLDVLLEFKVASAFKIIEKRSDRNPGTNKHQTTAEDIRVSVRNIGKRDRIDSRSV
jgi:hypothetical protein